MDFSIVPVSKVFKTYQGQARMGELNKNNPVKREQGQKDRVTISNAARQALLNKPKVQAAPPAPKPAEVEAVENSAGEAVAAESDFVPGI